MQYIASLLDISMDIASDTFYYLNIQNYAQQTRHIPNVTQNVLSFNNKEDYEIESLKHGVPDPDS